MSCLFVKLCLATSLPYFLPVYSINLVNSKEPIVSRTIQNALELDDFMGMILRNYHMFKGCSCSPSFQICSGDPL